MVTSQEAHFLPVALSSPLPKTMPLLLHLPPLPHHRPTTSLPKPLRPIEQLKILKPPKATSSSSPSPSPSSRPARDRVIDFGKYKGQMLGTLPPAYLRWVAKELDYGDTAPWARLARTVLDDPVYVDRVEWDHAHRFLRGDANYDYAYDDADTGDDGPLHEMADRFGWDLSDEDGWSQLDFRLLGTSFGGLIPRKGGHCASRDARGNAKKGPLFSIGDNPEAPKDKRDERRERMRLRREEQVRTAKMDTLGLKAGREEGDDAVGSPRKARIRTVKGEILGLGRGNGAGIGDGGRRSGGGVLGERGNPFPGRQAFLDKVKKLKD